MASGRISTNCVVRYRHRLRAGQYKQEGGGGMSGGEVEAEIMLQKMEGGETQRATMSHPHPPEAHQQEYELCFQAVLVATANIQAGETLNIAR